MDSLSADLESFFSSIHMDSTEEYDGTIKSVAKVLNRHYYGSDSEVDHMLVVGSVGRGTAVSGTSDLDLLYELPHSEYSRFNSYKDNGQSALLQAVKEVLLSRWPKTNVKGDGQAVVISFTDRNFSIDLVPAFEQADGSFKYPDSNNGGSWKRTDPIPEQRECRLDAKATRSDCAMRSASGRTSRASDSAACSSIRWSTTFSRRKATICLSTTRRDTTCSSTLSPGCRGRMPSRAIGWP